MPVSTTDNSTPGGRTRIVGIGILLILIGSVIGYFIYQTISPNNGALYVEAVPQSIVYIDGVQKGKTPFEVELKADEVEVKIVPESFNVPLSPYSAKVSLSEKVRTIVRRNFGESIETASGEIISFEKQSQDETDIAIVSDPDGVAVSVDGQNKGVTPLKISTSPGEHSIGLSSSGYQESSFSVRAVSGYKLTVVADLAKLSEEENPEVMAESDSQDDEPAKDSVEKIEIIETSVGFLRVRAEPSVQSEELGRVSPGDRYEILDHSEEGDWYKIEFEDENMGWISGEYAQIVEE